MGKKRMLLVSFSSTPCAHSLIFLYSDTANPRTLGHLALESSSLSVENCIAQCVAGGYHYAGVEYGQVSPRHNLYFFNRN